MGTAFRLPVSGLEVIFRQTTGAEDILLAEEQNLDIRLALALADVLVRLPNGEAAPWESLPVTDLDAALMVMRRLLVGDEVRSNVVCAMAAGDAKKGCRARVDITFRIGDYLSHHAPSAARDASPAEERGWWRLDGAEATYRFVSCGDQIAIEGRSDAEQELARRCIRPEGVAGSLRRRVEAAMAKLAPNLIGDLDGVCPECGARIRVAFDPLRYVLGELREQAKFVFEEIHLIARHYHWSEKEILALPSARRARYAELASLSRGER